ncbi:YhgE/Pip domain-containing protein [Alicyclobacillus dauci]|uniref:ABC transporter permease n=1 Tax=Alicyclobacillus dauci TaxID=1475485 RepID=A0ABY6Z1C5_9BACL|nr:hypothetical protein [Alicyclobacillus dauci]WAH36156.1 ABC transporter permease [Alicyclobacillus dauci]
MKEALILVLTHRFTRFALVMGIFYQFLFITVWMIGFGSVPAQMSKLKVAIINQDTSMSAQVQNDLKKHLPFQVQTAHSLPRAIEQLQQRKIVMIIEIPNGFFKDVRNLKTQAHLDYYINESNPMLASMTAQQSASQITEDFNQELTKRALQGILQGLHVPGNRAQTIVQQSMNRVVPDVHILYPVSNMGYIMSPMMFGMAGYVSAMILQLNLNNAIRDLGDKLAKWRRFQTRMIISVAASFVYAYIASTYLAAWGTPIRQGFLQLWVFQTTAEFAYMFLTQIPALLFGMYGLLFNIGMLIAQAIYSGASIPRMILPRLVNILGYVQPMPYAVEGVQNIVLGGPSVTRDGVALLVYAIVCLLLCFLISELKDRRQE